MALSKKHLQQLKSTMRRRDARPVSTYQPPVSLEISRRDRDQITNSNPKLLLSIESLIVNMAGRFPQMVDEDVKQALIAVIRQHNVSGDGPVPSLVQELTALLERQANLGDSGEQGLMALRAILSSVETRSGQIGTRHYLDYAASFVARVPLASRRAF